MVPRPYFTLVLYENFFKNMEFKTMPLESLNHLFGERFLTFVFLNAPELILRRRSGEKCPPVLLIGIHVWEPLAGITINEALLGAS